MYILKQHKNLSPEKWYSYPKSQQVLMIANELNRAKNWIGKEAFIQVDACYERALELTDLTSEDRKWENKALMELRRFRERLAMLYAASEKKAEENALLYRLLLQTVPEAWNLLHGKED